MKVLTLDQAMDAITTAIGQVAPDVADEVLSTDRTVDVWEELELDSMDHLNVMTGLWEATGIEIAERDYAALRSLDAMAAHLATASGAA